MVNPALDVTKHLFGNLVALLALGLNLGSARVCQFMSGYRHE